MEMVKVIKIKINLACAATENFVVVEDGNQNRNQ